MITKLLTTVFVASALFVNAQSGLTNLDFENWTSNMPDGFSGSGISEQTTGAQNGTSYARITIATPSGGSADGIMLLGSSLTMHGAPYAQRPYAIMGYYRCFFAGADTMAIGAGLSNSGADAAPIDFYPIPESQSNWTPFTLPFNYVNGSTPDTIDLIFFANKNFIVGRPNTAGSYLEVDNISIDFSSGYMPYEEAQFHFNAYPNPASDKLYITSSGIKTGFASIHDLTGRLVKNYEFNAPAVSIDVSSFEQGIYVYYIKDKYGVTLYSDKLIIAK